MSTLLFGQRTAASLPKTTFNATAEFESRAHFAAGQSFGDGQEQFSLDAVHFALLDQRTCGPVRGIDGWEAMFGKASGVGED